MEKFKNIINDEEIIKSLETENIYTASPIQEKAIPEILAGKDIIGQAKTGTGKTFAFAIPLIMQLDESKPFSNLIICPTRELAKQVSNEIDKLIKFKKNIKTVTIYGGTSYRRQEMQFKQKPQIVIGTPGRIIDYLEKGKISFKNLDKIVLDEADEMLKMGFQEDIDKILKNTPKEKQTLLFSATMPAYIKKVAKELQHNPEIVNVIQNEPKTADNIVQYGYLVTSQDKKHLLLRVLDLYDFTKTLIFCNTKREVDYVNSFLQDRGYLVANIHGDLKQEQREVVLKNFRDGYLRILVATDVAARGLDIENLEGIINFDIPEQMELYIHRIGRTGRANNSGVSITFFDLKEQRKIAQLEKYTSSKINIKALPTVEEINEHREQKTFEEIVNYSNYRNNYEVINKLVTEGGMHEKEIINRLLSILYSKTSKDYKDIKNFEYREKKENSKPEFAPEVVSVQINIGKNDKINPKGLLKLISSNSKVYEKSIGDIKINTKNTFFEIQKSSFAYLKNLDGKKISDKVIKITKVGGMKKQNENKRRQIQGKKTPNYESRNHKRNYR